MAPPQNVVQWVNTTYPRPRVDPEWLDACYTWIITELEATSLSQIQSHITSQLLQSDLNDSMLPGTGLPPNISTFNNTRVKNILVEITSIMDIGVSAFTLGNSRATRMERADLAEIYEVEGEEEVGEEEGKIPKYPRSMLKMELSDGAIVLPAIEYRSMSQLELGATKLGCKMILKDVLIRGGIAFLEPNCVEMKGYQTEDREVNQDTDFVRGLRARMGQPYPGPEKGNQPSAQPAPPLSASPRAPLRELSAPPVPRPRNYNDSNHLRNQRINDSQPQATSSTLAQPTSSSSEYFTSLPPSTSTLAFATERFLSPVGPLTMEEFMGEDDDRNGNGSSDFGDMDMDDAFLAEVQQVEMAAMGINFTTSSNPNPNSVRPQARDVITIDEDEEEDKENIPVHVRRQIVPGGVIEIFSDSE